MCDKTGYWYCTPTPTTSTGQEVTFSVSGGGINITTPCDDWNQSARDIHSDRIEQAIAYLRLAAKALRGEI